MRVLVLEDNEERTKVFRREIPSAKIVSTAGEAIDALSAEDFSVVFLDHDLGGEIYCDSERADTGMEVARWLSANPRSNMRVVCHSQNAPAAEEMISKLGENVALAVRIPFIHLKEKGISLVAESMASFLA